MVESATSTVPGAAPRHDRAEQVADALRELDPPRPRRHEPLAPLVHERRDALPRRERQPPERVAVDVEAVAVVEREAVAEAGERVGGVERLGL